MRADLRSAIRRLGKLVADGSEPVVLRVTLRPGDDEPTTVVTLLCHRGGAVEIPNDDDGGTPCRDDRR